MESAPSALPELGRGDIGPIAGRIDRGIDTLKLRLLFLNVVGLVSLVALPGSLRSFGAEQPAQLPWLVSPGPAAPVAPAVPDWLKPHVGESEGQIAPVVLQRARALYLQKVSEGMVRNPCYFAMDATRPAGLGRRFYVICEAERTFRAVPAGHGNGRNLRGVPDFSNGIRCAENFSNAMDSKLTTGGPYVTAEIRTSFKGYYRSAGRYASLMRSFVQFDGAGDTANARDRAIGGHPALVLRVSCRLKAPDSPYADSDGYVPYGTLVNYSAGRSNGCTTWPPSDAEKILAMVKDNATTLYIYPESTDIVAVARAVKAGKSLSRAGLYWNSSCLREIRVPKFWPKETLEPALAEYKKDHPPPPPQPPPICKVR